MRLYYRDSNFITKWWYRLDHNILFASFLIMLVGVIMIYSSSPAVAERIGLELSYFYYRQLYFVVIAFVIMLCVSTLSVDHIKKICLLGLCVTICMVFIVLCSEPQLKGAKRWLKIFGFSLQPSEFLKPFFIVINAWFLSRKFVRDKYPGYLASIFLLLVVLIGLVLEPDFGMSLNFVAIWMVQLYLSMVPYSVILILLVLGIGGITIAYYSLSHVKFRIDKFLFSDSGDQTYQVTKSLEAIDAGGLWGKGLFEGKVKMVLPDAHTDFVFAVMIEELGMVVAFVVLALYLVIILRIFINLKNIDDIFVKLILIGIVYQISFQVFVNVGVNLNLLPTKGMTLPLISYGGSSMLATAILLGILLAVNQKNFGRFTR